MGAIFKCKPNLVPLLLLVFLLSSCGSSPPNEQRIKDDLVGKKISDGVKGWVCESPAEFKQFTIADRKVSGDSATYTVNVTAGNQQSEGTALLTIEYKKEGSTWRMAGLKAASVELRGQK